MHGDAHDILGERDLAGLAIPRPDLTGYGVVGIEHIVLDQRLHGLEAAAAGDHGIALGSRLSPWLAGRGRLPRSGILAGLVDPDDEVFQKAEGGDRGLEFGVGPGIGRCLADVLGASASELSGISRMSGSALGAMKFMPVSMEGCTDTAREALSARPAPAPELRCSASRRCTDGSVEPRLGLVERRSRRCRRCERQFRGRERSRGAHADPFVLAVVHDWTDRQHRGRRACRVREEPGARRTKR